MPTAGIKVLFIGKPWPVPYDTQLCTDPKDILGHVARFLPDIIITSVYNSGALALSSFELRKKWLYVHPDSSVESVIKRIEDCYYFNLWSRHKHQNAHPLVSVYTGAFNTGDFIRDTYQSLREQTYPTWEWVVVDDESTDGTWDKLMAMAYEDHRVRPFRMRHNGKIGCAKDTATRLAYGEYVVELDHDDMLCDYALDEIVKAFRDPDVSMVYTNCANFYADGRPHMFESEFWKPRYRDTLYRGKVYKECINPDIYGRSGSWHQHQWAFALLYGPNHARCYRTKLLREYGGYNRNLPVADDLDLYMKFFLNSSTPEEKHPKGRPKCVHLDKMCYLYRFHDAGANTTFTRNKSIQDHVALCQKNYDNAFQVMNVKRETISPTPMPKVAWSIIVLDWNTENTTVACLRSIKASYPDAEIILVQNGRHFDCELASKTIKLETNVGFAAGCNRGAMEATGSHLLFLNSDAVLTKGVLEEFEKIMYDSQVGAVGPWSNQVRDPQRSDKANGVKEVDSLSGFCLAMRRGVFHVVGGFDTQFCNFEDDDFCKRITIAGGKLVVANTWVQHQEHTSFVTNNVSVTEKIEESRKLFNAKWPKIRVVAITLNEMTALPGFFEQFKGITDDFYIMDSGSTDGTTEWAANHGVKVFKREFDNFANQRNAALKINPVHTDWVIMFDPDERLDPMTLSSIGALARSNKYDIYLTPLDSVNYDNTRQSWVPKVFMFRDKPGIEWVNPVHEKLIGSMKQAMIKNGMNTHYLNLHSPDRRTSMQEMYNKLGQDAKQDDKWPILNYKHRDDDRIDKIFVGPQVSVIIPTYKRSFLRSRAIQSVRNQDYMNIEIIVIGDNDPEFVQSMDCRCLNLPKNHGAGGAEPRNYGIMMASGPLIGYCDDDNTLRKDHVSSLMMEFFTKNVDIAFASLDLGDGKVLKAVEPVKGQIDTSAVIHKKHLVQQFGWWNDRSVDGYAHDFAFFNRFVKGGAKWAATQLGTVLYNIETCGQAEFLNNLRRSL